MTKLALQPEIASVDLGFSMAIKAIRRRALEDLGGSLVEVTRVAFDFSMPAIQNEKVVMVETMHAIDAIVTVQAGRPELFLVLRHERAVMVGMAGDAGWLRIPLDVIFMASCTRYRIAVVVHLVASQGKRGVDIVVEGLPAQKSRAPGKGVVAGGTIRIKNSSVAWWFYVTGNAVDGRPNKATIHVTAGALKR